jgi:hypothetical protein
MKGTRRFRDFRDSNTLLSDGGLIFCPFDSPEDKASSRRNGDASVFVRDRYYAVYATGDAPIIQAHALTGYLPSWLFTIEYQNQFLPLEIPPYKLIIELLIQLIDKEVDFEDDGEGNFFIPFELDA